MKYIHLYAVLGLAVVCSSCTQHPKELPKGTSKAEAKEVVTPYGPNTMVRNIKKGRNNTILIAASFAGVFRYDKKLFTNLTAAIGSRRYWDVLEDRRGNTWFATTDSGVYRFDGIAFQHFTTKEGLPSNGVMSMYEDRAGMIWFGTGNGISRYDGQSFRNFTPKEGRSNNEITTILEDRKGNLWIGTRGEAFMYDGKNFTTLISISGKPFHNVWAILEDRKGVIWLGGSILKDRKGSIFYVEDGLWRRDGDSFTKVSDRGTSAIIQDKKGNIWTTGSVNPPNGNVWALSRYDEKSLYSAKPTVTEIMSIKGPGMLCGIYEANDGSIWFGALGAKSGVYRYDGKTITDFKRPVK